MNSLTHARNVDLPSRPTLGRRLAIGLMLVAVMLTGCRAVAAGLVVGAVAGFVVASAAYEPPPSYHVHDGHYYSHGRWHHHAPDYHAVRIYYYQGTWYESRGHHRHHRHHHWDD